MAYPAVQLMLLHLPPTNELCKGGSHPFVVSPLQAEVRWATSARPTMRLARLARQDALQAAAYQLGSNVVLLGHHAGQLLRD